MDKKHVAIFAVSFILLTTPSLLATNFAATTPVTTPPIVEWTQQYGTGNLIRAMIQTNDGGYALAGVAMSIVIGGVGPWLIKVDSSGNKQWEEFYFDKKMNVNLGGTNSVVQTLDDGYALAGGSYLYKTNSTGNLQWRQFYSDVDISSLVNSGDGYTLAGSKNGAYWLAKVDLTGQIVWNYTYGGEIESRSMSMVQTSDGGYAIAGNRNTNDSDYIVWLVKTDSLGNMSWNQTYGKPLSSAYSLIQTRSGSFVIAGTMLDFKGSAANSSVLLIKTDSDGNMVWNQTYNDGAAWSVIQTSDGGYALACGSGGSPGNLVKIDSEGNLRWSLASNVTLYSVVQTNDGGYAFAGGNGVGNNWLTKTTASSNSPSLSPAPSIPEFQLWTALLLIGIIVATVGLSVYHKKHKQNKFDKYA